MCACDLGVTLQNYLNLINHLHALERGLTFPPFVYTEEYRLASKARAASEEVTALYQQALQEYGRVAQQNAPEAVVFALAWSVPSEISS